MTEEKYYDTEEGVWVEGPLPTTPTLDNQGFAGLIIVILAGIIIITWAWHTSKDWMTNR